MTKTIDYLKAEKTVLGTELCSSSVSLSLPLDELPGPSRLQSTKSTHSASSDAQKAMGQHSSATTAKPSDACYVKLHNLSAIVEKISVSESAIKKWTIESYFEKIQARVPVLSGVRSSLEEWEKSLNGLTQLKKFRELGTLMYGDPTQGPSIVSSIEFDKDQEFFAVGGVTRKLKVCEYHTVITRPVSVHYPVQDLTCASRVRCIHPHMDTNTHNTGFCYWPLYSVDVAEMLQTLCTTKCYCRISFKCNIRVFITNWSQELNTKLCTLVKD